MIKPVLPKAAKVLGAKDKLIIRADSQYILEIKRLIKNLDTKQALLQVTVK